MTPLQREILNVLKSADGPVGSFTIFCKVKHSINQWHVDRTLGQLRRESLTYKSRKGWVITELGLMGIDHP